MPDSKGSNEAHAELNHAMVTSNDEAGVELGKEIDIFKAFINACA